MSKAHDLEWNFLKKVMKKLGLRMLGLIRSCGVFRINSWSKRLLSYSGKEIFIKSILQSLSTYTFSIFLAPGGILEDMQSKISQIWWVGKERGRGWSMLAWDRVYLSKGMGGLAFVIFISLTWLSLADNITTVAKALENGFSWHVGDGSSIDICKHNWGFEGLNDDSLCSTTLTIHERKVKDLWNNNHMCWNKERVRELYGCTKGDQICKMPILANGLNNRRVLFHNLHGCYTFNFASRHSSSRWCVGHELLPMNAKITSIRQYFKNECPRCGVKEETLIHALKDCPTTQAILALKGLDNRLLVRDYSIALTGLKT
ncbi:hypothetical protein CXB51_021874 [Gossypium anomalum]|uniref:Reverse transcriptase zinc-binding domain-containing protein n=1 Tax=Gossypium anomalum TaxID=47600 RepID=A0A8J5Z793_9ROSI|nr:hypothetical protein CXB51_021874 [Gossypium anomalum]